MEIRQHLSQVDLFKGLTVEELEAIARIVSNKEYKKGQLIFSEGDEGVGFYLVISGRVKVYKLSPEGKEQIMHIFGPGQPFAEVPVFEGSRYPANAETMDNCKLFFFPEKGLCLSHPGKPLSGHEHAGFAFPTFEAVFKFDRNPFPQGSPRQARVLSPLSE
jgi:hypothetical protein